MESVKTRELSAALTYAKKVLDLKHEVSGLYLSRDGIRAISWDRRLEVAFSGPLEGMPAEVEVPVEVGALVKALKEWKAADALEVTVEDGAVCTAGVTLPSVNLEDLEGLEDYGPRLWAGDVPADTLAGVATFAATDEMRPVLAAVRVEAGRVMATDAFRLGMDTGIGLNLGEVEGLTIPVDACRAAAAAAVSYVEVGILKDGKAAALGVTNKFGSHLELKVPTVDGQFPNVERIIPDRDAWQLEARLELEAAIGQLEKVERWQEKNRPAILELNGTVEVSLEVPGGATVAPVSVSGPVHRINGAVVEEPVRIGVNPEFLKSGVEFLEEPVLRAISPLRAMMLEDGDRSVLVMPIKLQD